MNYNAPLIESWPNFPPEEEPLTVIDTVELALAYNCQLSQETLVKYIHYNRLSSIQKISVLESKMKLVEQTVNDQKVCSTQEMEKLFDRKMKEMEMKMKNLEQTTSRFFFKIFCLIK